MGLYRQGYWSGLPFYFPGDLPDPGIETGSRTAGRPFTVSHQGSLLQKSLVKKEKWGVIAFGGRRQV